MRAIKRYYEMEDFVRIAGDKEGFMPRRFCGYILSLVQRAEDCLPPNSFFVW